MNNSQEDTSAIQTPPDILAENRKRIESLEVDLAAAKLIILDAGKQVAFKNAALKSIADYAAVCKDNFDSYDDERSFEIIRNQALEALQSPALVQAAPVSPKPKFMVDDKVILAGERDKGIRTINSVHPSPSGEYQYKVITESGNLSQNYWYESELELYYRPSWNLTKLAKESASNE
jgi:hypothetical protein